MFNKTSQDRHISHYICNVQHSSYCDGFSHKPTTVNKPFRMTSPLISLPYCLYFGPNSEFKMKPGLIWCKIVWKLIGDELKPAKIKTII